MKKEKRGGGPAGGPPPPPPRAPRGGAPGEKGEPEGLTECEAIPVDQASAALLLPVDGDVGVAVELLELEIAPVEHDLGVVIPDGSIGDVHVVAGPATDRGHGLVDREQHRRPIRRKIAQHRHRFREGSRTPAGPGGASVEDAGQREARTALRGERDDAGERRQSGLGIPC